MKKLFLIFAVLTLSVGLWAEEQRVSYVYPVYNTEGDPTSGIKEWGKASVNATVVMKANERVDWYTDWYVVTGTNVTLANGAVCKGNVKLILADGAQLNAIGKVDYSTNKANPGIQVSGENSSLTIYGQTEDSGKLFATGVEEAAGIGGGFDDSGSNITINGGIVKATGGFNSAGIGGGESGSGTNITINGGTVTANGASSCSGIGGGLHGGASNIFIATELIIKADGNNPPETVITNKGGDIANELAGKQYVTIEPNLIPFKDAAIVELNAAINGITDEDILAIADKAITDINNASSKVRINAIKTQALQDIVKAEAIAQITSACQDIQNAESTV